MSKKKVVFKAVLFAAIFAILWMGFQHVLGYDWNRSERMGTRYDAFNAEPDGTVDLLILGSSNTYADIAPAVIYEESGITSFNMSTSNNITFLMYYQLQYLLKVQKPKMLVIDIAGLSGEKDLNENEDDFEKIYRKITDSMPDFKLKLQLIREICKLYDNQDAKTYLFPLLRYHDRWEELTDRDFDHSIAEKEYEPFTKGCYLNTKIVPLKWPDDIFTYHGGDAVPLYLEYLQKILDLCRENDIEVMLLMCPKTMSRYGDFSGAKEFAEQNGLTFLSFETQEKVADAGIDLQRHFYDKKHLNILGQKTFSLVLADWLAANTDLPDHRGDPAYGNWEETVRSYEEYYDSHKDKMELLEPQE